MGKLNKYQLSRRCDCHPEREHVAKGMCGPCYYRQHRQKTNNAQHIKWRLEHLDQLKGYIREYAYGISPQRFAEMLKSQRGKCAVCDEILILETTAGKGRSKTVHIDHDHTCCSERISCGKCVRGLLCGDCNRGLGSFHDDPIVLLKAIEYLLKISFQE
jgi:hypothetical protein